MVSTSTSDQWGDRRYLVTELLMAALIGIAFQEAVGAARESVRGEAADKAAQIAKQLGAPAHSPETALLPGIPDGTAVLFAVFFLTALRFFIGNLLHLKDLAQNNQSFKIWLFDLFFIVAQTVCIVFLGGLCSIEVSRVLKGHFVHVLLTLFALDLIWIVLQRVLAVFPSWQRRSYPWPWFWINLVQFVLFLAVGEYYGNYFEGWMLGGLLGVSVIAFFVDLVMANQVVKSDERV